MSRHQPAKAAAAGLKRTLSLSATAAEDGVNAVSAESRARDLGPSAPSSGGGGGRQRTGHGRFAHRLEMRNRNFTGSTQVMNKLHQLSSQ